MKLLLIHGSFGLKLPLKTAVFSGLRSATGNLHLNYNQRPAGRPVEVIGLESAGKRKRVETGIQ